MSVLRYGDGYINKIVWLKIYLLISLLINEPRQFTYVCLGSVWDIRFILLITK